MSFIKIWDKKFFDIEGSLILWIWIFWKIQRGTLLCQKKFLSPIPLKFHVLNSLAIRISNFEFHQNLRQKFFDIFNPDQHGLFGLSIARGGVESARNGFWVVTASFFIQMNQTWSQVKAGIFINQKSHWTHCYDV